MHRKLLKTFYYFFNSFLKCFNLDIFKEKTLRATWLTNKTNIVVTSFAESSTFMA